MAFDMNLMASNMDVLGKEFKTDELTMKAMGAFILTAVGKSADAARLSECKDIIKSQFGPLSEFRQNMELPLIVKMSIADSPKDYINGVSAAYDKLSENYKAGDELRLVAAMVLYDNLGDVDMGEMCSKTEDIFSLMNNEKSLLTDQSYLSFAVLLAMQSEDANAAVKDMKECFGILHEENKLSKKEAMMISAILALKNGSAVDKCKSFVGLNDRLKDEKLAIKGQQKTILSVLCEGDTDIDKTVNMIKENEEALKSIKAFNKVLGIDGSTRKMFAAAVTALNNTDDTGSAEAAVMSTTLSVVLSVEMIALMVTLFFPV